jgi:phosphoglycerate dehydrogenase-like enzyme
VRCAVLDDYQGVALSMADWSSVLDQVEVDVLSEHLREDELVARIAGCAILVVMRERTPLPAGLLARLPELRLIVTTGMANASIDTKEAASRGIVVCGTPSRSEPPAELTWALLLGLARQVAPENAAFHEGGPWQSSVGQDLCGRRLGLLGLGKIGSRVSAVGLAFGMDVVAWSANLTAERCAERGVTLAPSKLELLRTSDFVSIHLRLGERSRGLIGAQELAAMKPTAYLVNTSRAGIIDQDDLREALRHNVIAGAGLDVFEDEPVPLEDELRRLPNVLATPHLGYVTRRNYDEAYFPHVIEDIRAFLDGTPVRQLA